MAEATKENKVKDAPVPGAIPSAFRFKEKASSSSKRRASSHKDSLRSHEEKLLDPFFQESSAKRHHKRSRRHSPVDDPSLYDDTYLPNAASHKYADPEVAFRESLFDAMADDEGAAFWEGVYGQPIHVYPNEKQGPNGELERMTDEEYAEYVRARMYEKTHQHVIEERERQQRARQRRQEEEAIQDAERKRRRMLDSSIEDSLKRGAERRRKRQAEKEWRDYQTKWEALISGSQLESNARDAIPWPTETADMDEINPDEVERFFRNGAILSEPESKHASLVALLKVERVRWHPDKMQQKLGKSSINDEVMASITAVFQIIDKLWSEHRTKGESTG